MRLPVLFNVWQKLGPIKSYLDFNTKYFDFKMQGLRKSIIHGALQEILAEQDDNLCFEIISRYSQFSDAKSLFVHLFSLNQFA